MGFSIGGAIKGAVGGLASGGGIKGAIAGGIAGLTSGGAKAQAQQAVAQNSSALGNALNGSGGKVMMAIPVEKVEPIAKLIATA